MTKSSKLVGVIGGMGPDATIDFMTKVIALTPAGQDQDHVRMLVDHNPKIPSRHDAVLGDGETPGPVLAKMASGLEVAGADFLVMPCNMAHIFQNEIAAATNIPLISIIDETVMAIRCDQPDAKAIGLLASEGCIRSGMYQAALEEKGLVPVLQTESELAKLMTLINSIKAGMRAEQVAIDMQNLATTMIGRGAQVIVAACTEIPLVLDEKMLSVPLISSTDVLAQKTVALARCDVALPE